MTKKQNTMCNLQQEFEIWKDINGCEGRYQISNHGRVKSVARTIFFKKTNKIHRYIDEIIKKTTFSDYERVKMNNDNGCKLTFLVHRLVAIAFIPNPENKITVNHKNGNKGDNRSCNLEWATYIENNAHSIANGLYRCGGKPVYKYDEYGKFIAKYNTVREAAKSVPVTPEFVTKCAMGVIKSTKGFVFKYAEK